MGLRWLSALVVGIVGGAACENNKTGPGTDVAATVTSLSVTCAQTQIWWGQNVQCTARQTMSNGALPDVTARATWTVDTSRVATVSSTGVVTGAGEGTTAVQAAVDGRTATFSITVPGCTPSYAAVGPDTPGGRSWSVGSNGGVRQVQITLSPDRNDCPPSWRSLVLSGNFLTSITPSSGRLSSLVTLTIAANSGSSRTARVGFMRELCSPFCSGEASENSFTITQAAGAAFFAAGHAWEPLITPPAAWVSPVQDAKMPD